MSVRAVVEEVGYSHRHFTKLFTEQVGLPPKLFSRLRRFQQALMISRARDANWGAIAQECGYSDQSHMIRDLREFSCVAPGELSEASTTGLLDNHLAIVA
jgi:AraC-like DNA-binding protein